MPQLITDNSFIEIDAITKWNVALTTTLNGYHLKLYGKAQGVVLLEEELFFVLAVGKVPADDEPEIEKSLGNLGMEILHYKISEAKINNADLHIREIFGMYLNLAGKLLGKPTGELSYFSSFIRKIIHLPIDAKISFPFMEGDYTRTHAIMILKSIDIPVPMEISVTTHYEQTFMPSTKTIVYNPNEEEI